MVTQPMAGVGADLPVMRDPDGHVYFKEEVGGLLMGGFDPWAKPWGMDGIPPDFSFATLPEDWEKFEILMSNAIVRVPVLEAARGAPAHERAGELHPGQLLHPRRGARSCAATTSPPASAPAASPRRAGAGHALAEWIADGPRADGPLAGRRPPLRALPRRPALPARARERDRGRALLRGLPEPRARQRPRAPPLAALRPAPDARRLLRRQDGLGARQLVRADRRAGGDRVLVRPAELVRPRGRRAPRRPRGGGASSTRPRSASSSSRAPTPPPCCSACAPTTWTCRRGASSTRACSTSSGGYESDLTVTRLAEDAYLIVTGSAQTTRDASWIRRNVPDGARASSDRRDRARGRCWASWARGRASSCRALTAAELSNDAFPFATMREIDLGHAPVRAARITYVGELGWELYVPVEFAAGVYEALLGAGRGPGARRRRLLRHRLPPHGEGVPRVGPRAHHRGQPVEAGLGFAVRPDKPGGFIGRDAFLRARGAAADPAARELRPRGSGRACVGRRAHPVRRPCRRAP